MTQIIFFSLIAFVIAQRLFELIVASINTNAILKKGGVEFGRNHYWILVTLHSAFFVSIGLEAMLNGVTLSPYFGIALSIFFAAQLGRIWVIRSMGGRWTTRVLVIKGETLVSAGPFRWLPHPNYTIVAIEIFALPLVFNLFFTSILFSVLNAIVLLAIRLPVERKALRWVKELP